MVPLQKPGTRKDFEEKHLKKIANFVSDIRNEKLCGSNKIAIATISLLEQIIIDSKNLSGLELCALIRDVGQGVRRALPEEFVASNMVRRVLRAIRDEYRAHANQTGEGTAGESLQRLVLAAPSRRPTFGTGQHDLWEPIQDHIAELRGEIESSTMSICSTAREQVHADELILTYGASSLVECFLKSCIKRRYKLILAEGADYENSHAMANRLSLAGVPVTVISNAAVYGVMSRVNKVLVGVRAVLAGGEVLAGAGMHAVTLAAKHHSVPVIALAPLYKLSSLYAYNDFNSLASPHRSLPYGEANSDITHVLTPRYDFIPRDHVTLFITNVGGISPSYIYRLLSELYDFKDYQM